MKLSMENEKKIETSNCGKCGAQYKPGVSECPNCGVLFKKLASAQSKNEVEKRRVRKAASPDPAMLGKRTLLFTAMLIGGILLIGSGFIYYKFIESRMDAKIFIPYITKYCTVVINEPPNQSYDNDDELIRTGKVLIVFPERSNTFVAETTGRIVTVNSPAELHSAWYKLKRGIRARTLDEVDTLVRVYKEIGKAGRYGKLKTKVYNTHKIILKVYDWENRTYIGSKVLDPGEVSSFMTDDDYEAMAKLTSDEAIIKIVYSMALEES